MGKSEELTFKNLPLINDDKESRGLLEKSILNSGGLMGRSNLFVYIARLYKTIAKNTLDNNLRGSTTKEAEYFLTQGLKYKNRYEFQLESRVKQFNVE